MTASAELDSEVSFTRYDTQLEFSYPILALLL